ncbi:helix-turn-helix domain-containing protein [Chitinophaga sp. XS-30]|uniref:helix-turn-helix domain-containing protein n=1 Tax=Chitinophaga sp. XS-30 TaxID=2604421 RepID=UPI0011DD54B6|nr:helix-turn-helix domain-containing protein [Chitinophaga sp. XS-30]QEH41629.1 helix-turn-helix transcriptional regulator [Chitinophaga sp. XS-30]
MKHQITSRKAYHETMVTIYKLMDKGEDNLKPEELKKLSAMVVAAEKYEDEVLGLKPQKEPETIAEAVELKMFEHKLTQSKLAEKLGLANSKLSEILSGKRKPDVQFLKVLYKVLKIDAGFLLEHA